MSVYEKQVDLLIRNGLVKSEDRQKSIELLQAKENLDQVRFTADSISPNIENQLKQTFDFLKQTVAREEGQAAEIERLVNRLSPLACLPGCQEEFLAVQTHVSRLNGYRQALQEFLSRFCSAFDASSHLEQKSEIMGQLQDAFNNLKKACSLQRG